MRLTNEVKEWMHIALYLGTDNMNRFDVCWDWIQDEGVVKSLIEEHGEEEAFDKAEAKIDRCMDEICRRLGV
tara:strand:- start:1632 stop:1847 length:216 start_codon:yes stop_codon:yes gene_type:complete